MTVLLHLPQTFSFFVMDTKPPPPTPPKKTKQNNNKQSRLFCLSLRKECDLINNVFTSNLDSSYLLFHSDNIWIMPTPVSAIVAAG